MEGKRSRAEFEKADGEAPAGIAGGWLATQGDNYSFSKPCQSLYLILICHSTALILKQSSRASQVDVRRACIYDLMSFMVRV